VVHPAGGWRVCRPHGGSARPLCGMPRSSSCLGRRRACATWGGAYDWWAGGDIVGRTCRQPNREKPCPTKI
jgi:hypothetical protein